MTLVSAITDVCGKGCRWPNPLCRKANCPMRLKRSEGLSPPPAADMPSDQRSILRDLHLAFAFLTRLPLPPLGLLPAGSLARTMGAFPLVGAVVGLLGGGVYAAAQTVLPPVLAALLAVAATVAVTGAMHEDGLADIADGFGGGGDRDRKLAIMKDSRVGSFGVVALTLGLALRVGALASLGSAAAALAGLIAAHSLARAAIPLTMQLLAPARETGLGAQAGQPTMRTAGIAATLAIVIAALALPPGAALAAVAAAAVGTLATAWLAWRQIGGHTGDVLGAIEQAVETASLLAIVAAL